MSIVLVEGEWFFFEECMIWFGFFGVIRFGWEGGCSIIVVRIVLGMGYVNVMILGMEGWE